MARSRLWMITVLLLGALGALFPIDAAAQPRLRPPSTDVLRSRMQHIQSDLPRYRRMRDQTKRGACASITAAVLHRLNSGRQLTESQHMQLARHNVSSWVQGRRPKLDLDGWARLREVEGAIETGYAPVGSSGYFDTGWADFHRNVVAIHRVPFIVTPEGMQLFEANEQGWESLQTLRDRMQRIVDSFGAFERWPIWVMGVEWVNRAAVDHQATR